jgi:serine/threonine protein kinase
LGKHPQIPELLAYFSQDNQQYLVQEFIDGKDLAQELTTNGAFNEAQVRSLLSDLLPVLQFVHQHHVIHRDIKPENIIRRRRDSQLVLVDFGASKVATGTALARTGTAIGSAGFAAPEQSFGRAVFASDIYGLGVTCIHLLTTMHPFDLFDPRENAWVWRNALKKPVSDALGRILDKMIESAINQRYQSAADVLKDLNPQTPQAVAAKQQKPSKPVVTPPQSPPAVTKPKGAIDAELAEISSQFLATPTPKSPAQKPAPQPASPPSQQTAKSQIDRELEELKSQFMGSTNPNNPPNQS